MKAKFIKFLFIAILASGLSTSCLDKGEDLEGFRVDYGEIVGSQTNYNIVLDNGTTLVITANMVPSYTVTNGKRIIADYTILSQETPPSGGKLYKVRLNYLYDVLCKTPALSSALNTPAKQDSIGYDLIEIREAWIGSKYLNVNFQIYRQLQDAPHFINLVLDQARSTNKNAYITLRHNAYNDAPSYISLGRVSFDISSIQNNVPVGDSVILHLGWKGFNNQETVHTITYKNKPILAN